MSHRFALLPLLGFLACTLPTPEPLDGDPAQRLPVRGGVIELGNQGDLRSLDPASITDGLAPAAVQLIYAGLLDYDHQGRLVDDLAESHSRSADGLHYSFRLRDGLRFHDGTTLEAVDVKRSVERALSPKAPNPSRAFYESLSGFDDFVQGRTAQLSGVRVDGRLDVSFHLARIDATFDRVLALQTLRPVCASMGDEVSPTAQPCGAGPFRVRRWERGSSLELARFDQFHLAGLPYLDGVRFSFHTTPLAQRFRFERGQQHVLRDFINSDFERFPADPRWKSNLFYQAETQMNAEGMNTEIPPFDQREVRRAVSFAIDRDAYALLRPSILRPLTQPVPQGVSGHNPALACQRFDRAEALRAMARAGYPYDPVTGQGGYPHPIPYLTYGEGLSYLTSQLLKQQLAQVGLRLDLRLTSYSTYMALAHRRGAVAMSYQGWSVDYSDPSNFTETLFHSRAIDDEGANNSAFYKNPELDALLDRGKTELDASRRREIYDRAQQIICDDAPWAFTYSIRWLNAVHPMVRDYASHPIWPYEFRRVWLAPRTQSAPLAWLRRGLP